MNKTGKAKKKTAKRKETREIHVLNGPNLNMLGLREPEIYGTDTLIDLEEKISDAAKEAKGEFVVRFFQTNYEGQMLEYIHTLVIENAKGGKIAGVIINPGAWTHASIALRDAVLMLKPLPMVEVHISNIIEREEYRHHSFIEDVVSYRVIGRGQDGYIDALRWLISELKKDRPDLH